MFRGVRALPAAGLGKLPATSRSRPVADSRVLLNIVGYHAILKNIFVKIVVRMKNAIYQIVWCAFEKI